MGSGTEKISKRKHADTDSEDDQSDKRHKHKKAKKEKKEKKDKDKEKQLVKEAKRFLKQKLKQGKESDKEFAPTGSSALLEEGAKIDEISEDSYFEKHAEFNAWLKEERRLFFNELTSEESRALFVEFVAAWNARKLPARYYVGNVGPAMKRTTHSWGLQGGQLGRGQVGMAAAMAEDDENRLAAREGEKAERREWRRNQKDLLDEMLPKATGREAKVDASMARREAAKAREDSPEMNRLIGGGDVMGGDDSFAAAKARQARQQDFRSKKSIVRQEELSQRAAAAAAVEDARMQQFRALVSGGPIQIRKRD